MTDTTSGALPGLRAGSPTVRPAGPGTGFSTRNLLGTKAAPLTDPWSGEDDDTRLRLRRHAVRQHLAPRRRARAASGGEPGRARSRVRVMNDTDWARLADAQLTHDSVPFEVGVSRYRELARGQIIGDSYGVLKLLVSLDTRHLLGVHVFGTGATELVHIGQAVMGCGGTVDYLVDAVFNYPTLAEAYKVAALDATNKMRQIARFA